MTLVAGPTGSISDHARGQQSRRETIGVAEGCAGAALGSALKGHEPPERGVRKALLSTVDVTGRV